MGASTGRKWDDEYDLVVIGAGAAGMTAALVGSIKGLKTLLCEKTDMVGGTTSTSGGTTWVPGSSQSARDGIPDRTEDAQRYLESILASHDGAEQRMAFLEAGPKAIDFLEQHTEVKYVAARVDPDYVANRPGAAHEGRSLNPLPFDGRLLGKDFCRVRPPRREFMAFGGMMVGKDELPLMLGPLRSLRAFSHVSKVMARYFLDRLRYRRGTRLMMGNALVARMLFSLRQRHVPILFETALDEVVVDEGAVAGVVVSSPEGMKAIRARKGVVLATGGICWNTELRRRLFPESARAYSLAPRTNTGDGVALAMQAGAALDEDVSSAGLWMPCSTLRHPDGPASVYPHIVLDRSKPGLIAVNSSGRRFCNEADSYHDFCMAMLRAHQSTPSIPSNLICDRRFIRTYGIGLIHQNVLSLKPFIASGYLIEADTVAGLAGRIGVDPAVLERTVADHNRLAETGIDEEFGRGTSDYNRAHGDPSHTPNPCLGPIGPGPFYAMAVRPADLASSAGLRGDGRGRVLDGEGEPIAGLYACGNDLASIFRGTYPGPGTTLGPAIVIAWSAAMDAASRA